MDMVRLHAWQVVPHLTVIRRPSTKLHMCVCECVSVYWVACVQSHPTRYCRRWWLTREQTQTIGITTKGKMASIFDNAIRPKPLVTLNVN